MSMILDWMVPPSGRAEIYPASHPVYFSKNSMKGEIQ